MKLNTIAYVCYQSAQESTLEYGDNPSILGICISEEKAQELCSNDGDAYTAFKLKEMLCKMNDTYNVNGKFVKGYEDDN